MAFHQYNKTQYNAAQYNADAFMWVVKSSEAIAPADSEVRQPIKALADAITNTDSRLAFPMRVLIEFLFLADTLTKAILNKGFSEALRVNDWIEIERKNQGNGNGWS